MNNTPNLFDYFELYPSLLEDFSPSRKPDDNVYWYLASPPFPTEPPGAI